jgi:hypothetical protein
VSVKGIRVVATDLETGEAAERVVQPGDFIVIPVAPLYLDGLVKHSTGTVQLTLKKAAQ